jgi:hypothetical protein
MKTYDVEHASIFPAYWHVNEMLANSFCEGTREDFKSILQKSVRRGDGPTLDVDLLLSCLQETLNFEQSLERRFASEVRMAFWRRYDGCLIGTVSLFDGHSGIQGRSVTWLQPSHI